MKRPHIETIPQGIRIGDLESPQSNSLNPFILNDITSTMYHTSNKNGTEFPNYREFETRSFCKPF